MSNPAQPRRPLRAALLVVSAAAAMAMAAGCKPEAPKQTEIPPKPGIDLSFDVPQAGAAQRVHVVTRDIPVGGAIPWHTHPGVEIAYVERGTVELEMAGRGKQLVEPGGHFMVPRGIVHAGRNTGEVLARLVLTYIVDREAPLRSPADPPEERQD